MAETLENGFFTPVYDALVERQLMAGVPRTFGIMVWVICGSLASVAGGMVHAYSRVRWFIT